MECRREGGQFRARRTTGRFIYTGALAITGHQGLSGSQLRHSLATIPVSPVMGSFLLIIVAQLTKLPLTHLYCTLYVDHRDVYLHCWAGLAFGSGINIDGQTVQKTG